MPFIVKAKLRKKKNDTYVLNLISPQRKVRKYISKFLLKALQHPHFILGKKPPLATGKIFLC